jgi:predicted amidophosphoribosyltransferase
MFFIMGVSPRERMLSYNGELIICPECGKYGRYEVFMTCMCLSLFFIPTFKWGKQYFVKSNCCGTVYQLDQEIGNAIAKGNDVQIRPEHLTKISNGNAGYGDEKTCGYCGYKTDEDFQYCPKCGRPL